MTRITILLGVALAAIVLLSQPQPCLSGWCPTYKCFGSNSCGNCLCVSRDYSGGVCVDIEAMPKLQRDGYRVLP